MWLGIQNQRQASVNMVTDLGGCSLDILEKREISCSSSQDSKFGSSSSQHSHHTNYSIIALRQNKYEQKLKNTEREKKPRNLRMTEIQSCVT